MIKNDKNDKKMIKKKEQTIQIFRIVSYYQMAF